MQEYAAPRLLNFGNFLLTNDNLRYMMGANRVARQSTGRFLNAANISIRHRLPLGQQSRCRTSGRTGRPDAQGRPLVRAAPPALLCRATRHSGRLLPLPHPHRQRNVLTSLFQAFKNIDLTQALGLINEIFPLLTTDMSNAEMIGYVTDLLPMLAKAELTSVHIPGDEDYYNATIRGMMVLVPDLDACREVLAEALQ